MTHSSLSQAILDTTTWNLKFNMAPTQLNILSLKPAPLPVVPKTLITNKPVAMNLKWNYN